MYLLHKIFLQKMLEQINFYFLTHRQRSIKELIKNV